MMNAAQTFNAQQKKTLTVSVQTQEHKAIAESVLSDFELRELAWGGRDYCVVVGEHMSVDNCDEILGAQILAALRNAIDVAEGRA